MVYAYKYRNIQELNLTCECEKYLASSCDKSLMERSTENRKHWRDERNLIKQMRIGSAYDLTQVVQCVKCVRSLMILQTFFVFYSGIRWESWYGRAERDLKFAVLLVDPHSGRPRTGIIPAWYGWDYANSQLSSFHCGKFSGNIIFHFSFYIGARCSSLMLGV